MRSSSPRVAFQAWPCEWSVPEKTRMYVSRPTNGSAAVLNTRTRSGPLGSGADLDLGRRTCGSRGRPVPRRRGRGSSGRTRRAGRAARCP